MMLVMWEVRAERISSCGISWTWCGEKRVEVLLERGLHSSGDVDPKRTTWCLSRAAAICIIPPSPMKHISTSESSVINISKFEVSTMVAGVLRWEASSCAMR